jgi:amino acid transporter
VISGSALVVDYVLTIAISIASGCEAIFSFLPPSLSAFRLPAELVVVAALTSLNLRGVKESVALLTPIFLAFLLTHIGLIGYGIFGHAGSLPHLLADTAQDTHQAISSLGLFGVIVIFLRAFSLGGGTFTGIEAVSNSTDILREPRVATGKRTMLYMAVSLAFTAGGILLCYLLNNVQYQEGKTLNASLWEVLVLDWRPGGFPLGLAIVWFTLLSEGALLFVAAQTGFVAGPRTLAAMAVDQWVPKRFAHLSERLVTQNGVISMGVAAALVLGYTRGAVDLLVVMYSINVFATFTLSQLGMVRHWWQVRKQELHWRRRFMCARTTATCAACSCRSMTCSRTCRSRNRRRRPTLRPTGRPRSSWSNRTPASGSTRCSRSSACSRATTRTSCSARSAWWIRASSRASRTSRRSRPRCAWISSATSSSRSGWATIRSTASRWAPT